MRGWLIVMLIWCGVNARESWSQWPAYQQNVQRTGAVEASIPWDRLRRAWQWRSHEAPRPAWAGPAMWDAYANIRDLPAMRDYDSAPHAILADGRVYFGSTTDDTVRCLSAETGRLLWSFATDGPVRLCPTWDAGRVYFAADDGAAYCVDGMSGRLVWRVTAAPPEQLRAESLLINNGRLIARHPIRTGVLVDGGIAYFGAALLPWEPGYLCAVDATTGKMDQPGTYRATLTGKTLEGPPALTQDQLVFPQGRVAPHLFRRADGSDLGMLQKSSGGSIVIVHQDQIMHGPGADSRRGGIAASSAATREQIATFGRGNAMVVDGDVAFMLADSQLMAASLKTRKQLWQVSVPSGLSLIKAGDALIAGGVDRVAAYAAASGELLWQHQAPGRVKGLAAGAGRLLVSTDEGVVACFAAGARELPSLPADQRPTKPADQPPLTKLRPLPAVEQGLLGDWVFRRDQTEGRSVRNRASGNSAATLNGPFRWARSADGTEEAVEWDGTGSANVSDDHRQAKLPTRDITVEALVRVDRPATWGGVASVVQDNGAFERGWVLGFRDDKFSFALCGRKTSLTAPQGRLTYLTAPHAFEPGNWAHVAGVYDGANMRLFVDGREVASSSAQRGEIWYPPKTHFELGAYRDDNEHHRTHGALYFVRLYDRALTAEQISRRAESAAEIAQRLPEPPGDQPDAAPLLAAGPVLNFEDPHTAEVAWETKTSQTCELQWWLDSRDGREDMQASWTLKSTGVKHRQRLTGLRANRRYQYRMVLADGEATSEFTCDTFFNYSPAFPRPANSNGGSWFAEQAETRGLCLVLGAGLAREAEQLAQSYRVLVLDREDDAIGRLRQNWRQAGRNGSCLTASTVDSVRDRGGLPGDWANLIVTEANNPQLGADESELMAQLKPGGGVLLELLATRPAKADAVNIVRSPDGRWWSRSRRADHEDVGHWSHLYGAADNAAYTGEALGGADSADDLIVQWLGRPGPRYQSDRSGRKPSPLAIGGRLYLQGWRRMVALDLHNGEPLWSLELPRFERFNVPRDCSNWCADERHVYAAVQNRVWQVDGATGEVLAQLPLPTEHKSHDWSWGYTARSGDKLLGTAVRSDAIWTNFWGDASNGWYDAKSGEVTAHVAGDALFAYHISGDSADAPQPAWVHRGLVLHSTITAAAGRIWFLECRNKDLLQGSVSKRRLSGKAAWEQMALVCLDADTGKVLSERRLEAEPGDVMVSLAYADGQLVLMTSSGGKFHVRALAAGGGEAGSKSAAPAGGPVAGMEPTEALWEQHVPWGRDNHGGHMSRPAVVNGTVYVRPFSFSLRDGKLQPQKMPVGGCGTYACTDQALFFRQSTVTVWNRETARTTTWQRLRPDCWLSTIPAGGMLLSPEGGGGCSCGTWLETSLGFKPKREFDADRK